MINTSKQSVPSRPCSHMRWYFYNHSSSAFHPHANRSQNAFQDDIFQKALLYCFLQNHFVWCHQRINVKHNQDNASLNLSSRTYIFPDECKSALPLVASDGILITLYSSVIIWSTSTSLSVHIQYMTTTFWFDLRLTPPDATGCRWDDFKITFYCSVLRNRRKCVFKNTHLKVKKRNKTTVQTC